jgi:hypothetical protein
VGTIVDDAKTASEWIAKALGTSEYRADFSPSSLWEIERFFEENTRNGNPTSKGLLGESFGSRVFSLGAYIGEVIIRAKGGAWRGNDEDPQAEINIELVLPDGAVCWPIQRVMKRIKNGPEDGIPAYGLGMGVTVGPRPKAARKKWWKF